MLDFPKNLWCHQELWWQLTKREVQGRYRGSQLGMGWSAISPLFMLAVYTFVFSQVFKARWGNIGAANPWTFAINLFAGLIVFNLFAECASKAPSLILNNPNYVKKVVFPLEVLAAVSVGSACYHALTSLGVLLTFQVLAFRYIPITALWLPIIWMPLLLTCLGISWLLAALGVFLRDIGQLIGVFISMLMFLSPVFYPLSAVPQSLQWLLNINPLALVIEETRQSLINGTQPNLINLAIQLLAALILCELCYRLFTKVRPAFADVV